MDVRSSFVNIAGTFGRLAKLSEAVIPAPTRAEAVVTVAERRLWLLLLPVLLVTAVLIAPGLNGDPLFFNGEILSVSHAGGLGLAHTVPDVIDSVATYSQMHSPGYFVLLHGWATLTGWSAPGLRMLSLLGAVLSVALVYRLGREIASPLVGVYAAATFGISALFIDYGHTIRMYSFMPGLTALAVWCYYRVISAHPRPTRLEWFGLFVSVPLLLYTHYFGIFPLLALGGYHLLFVRKDRRWVQVSLVVAVAGLLFAPWVGVMIEGLQRVAGNNSLQSRALDTRELLILTPYLFSNANLGLFGFLGLLAAFVALRDRVRGAWVIVSLLALTLASLALVNEFRTVIAPNRARYLLTIFPLLALFVGVGLQELHRFRRVFALLAVVVWVIGALTFAQGERLQRYNSTGTKTIEAYLRFPELLPRLRTVTEPGDFVLAFSWNAQPTETVNGGSIGDYYFQQLGLHSLTLPVMSYADDPDELARHMWLLPRTLRDRDAFWLVYESDRPHPDLALLRVSLLEAAFDHCQFALSDGRFQVERYVRVGVDCPPPPFFTPVLYQAAVGKIALFDGAITRANDDKLAVTTVWSHRRNFPTFNYNTSWQLFDSADEKVWQADVNLIPGDYEEQLFELETDELGLPDGDYLLKLVVYDWRTGEVLEAETGRGAPDQHLLPVAAVTLRDDGATFTFEPLLPLHTPDA